MHNYERDMRNILKTVFGYDGFKNAAQRTVCCALYKGAQCTCICMPPGSGKSLCFQLPAIMLENKVAIVFSSKLSYIKNQVGFLQSKGINASLLYIKIREKERVNVVRDLCSDFPKIKLLYCIPEIGRKTYFQDLVLNLKKRNLLSYIVLTEAQSISRSAYDYVPTYGKLEINEWHVYKNVPLIAVTPITTNEVIGDICKALKMKEPKIFKVAACQTDIHYDVWFLETLSDPYEHLKNFLNESLLVLNFSSSKIGQAIIYCREESTAKDISDRLNVFGFAAVAYHHRLKKSERRKIENQWIAGDISVITTTYSHRFLYNRSIRCIVHWTVPQSIAKYYRECTETQKYKCQPTCRIYFSLKEYSSIKLLIQNEKIMDDIKYNQNLLSELETTVSYCLSATCRHVTITGYFGQTSSFCKGKCDVCEDKDSVEVRRQKFLAYSNNIGQFRFETRDISEERAETGERKGESLKITLLPLDSEKTEIVQDVESNEEIAKAKNKLAFSNKNELSIGNDREIVKQLFEDWNFSNDTDWNSGKNKSWNPGKNKIWNSGKNKSGNSGKIKSWNFGNNKHSNFCNNKNSAIPVIDLDIPDNLASKLVIRNSVLDKKDLDKPAASLEACSSKRGHSTKRWISFDTHLEEPRKRRKVQCVESKSPSIAHTNLLKSVHRMKRTDRVEGNASASVSTNYATAEYLMDKYKLNKDAITLVPMKVAKAKSNSSNTIKTREMR